MTLPAPDWISFQADRAEGLDLLGLRPVQQIGNQRFDGVTTVTPKLRYLSVLAWIIWRYARPVRTHTASILGLPNCTGGPAI